MLTVSHPLNLSLAAFTEHILDWPNFSFFLKAFEVESAHIVSKGKYSSVFSATTREFGLISTFVYGRTYIFNRFITFEFTLKGKKLTTVKDILSSINNPPYFFKIIVDESNKLIELADPGETQFNFFILLILVLLVF